MTDQHQAPATARIGGPSSLRILIVGLAALAVAAIAAIALASSAPSPVSAVGPGPADANGYVGLAAATQNGTIIPGNPGIGMAGPGGPGGRGGGFHAITIAAKNGNSLSLKTDDGWTRTITVDSDTTITKAGATITFNDLNVGDTIAFRETRNTDGTFKITNIVVVLPQVAGQVTAVDGNNVTLKLRDGSSKTITLTDSTKFFSGRNAASKADVKVGAMIGAEGTVSGDTFTALQVQILPAAVNGTGPKGGRGFGPRGFGPRGGAPNGGSASPAPSANTSSS